MKKVILNGSDLKIEDIYSIVSDSSVEVEVSPEIISKIIESRKFVDSHSDSQIIYGINTGFGPMASHIIGRNQLLELQQNLIRSHAVGMGDPIKPEYVLAAMVVRLNTIVKGFSGVSKDLVLHLQSFINKRIIPIIPEHGAVGTSGDLVQLAHIALSLIGEGEVIYEGKRQQTKDVIKKLNITPYILKPKEGLALINGTSVMAGIAALLCIDTDKLINLAILSGSWALESVEGFKDSLSEVLHSLRPHPGQNEVASRMRSILETSQLLQDRKIFNKDKNLTETVQEIPKDVQDVYSLRCIPQILGPVVDSLAKTKEIVSVEINSVTDNPIVDVENEVFIHGGNFHGDYIAYAVDQLKMTIVKLTMLSERRINYFYNKKINRRFPPFINLDTPGLTLGLQALQFVATSTTSQSQTLAFPQYVHSISTNADNQDVVSMGTDAALLVAKVVENAFVVLTIELLSLAQATDYLKNQDKLSKTTHSLYLSIRSSFPPIIKDRVITQDLAKLVNQFKS